MEYKYDISGELFTRAEMLSGSGLRYKQIFKQIEDAYNAKQRPYCRCKGLDIPGQQVVIRRNKSGHPYTLARFAGDGGQHVAGCWHYDPQKDGKTKRRGGRRRAYEENEVTGIVDVNLEDSLFMQPIEPAQEGPRNKGRRSNKGGGASRGRATLLGLLRVLWTKAELTHWKPSFSGKRGWNTVQRRVKSALQKVSIRANPLCDLMFIPIEASADRHQDSHKDFREFMEPTKRSDDPKQYSSIIVSRLLGFDEDGENFIVRIDCLNNCTFLMTRSLHSYVKSRFRRELSVLKKEAQDRPDILIGALIFRVDDKDDCYLVQKLVVMRTINEYVPVESGEESSVARKAVDERRCFDKQLDYRGRDVHPDFRLLDAANDPVPMEVYAFKGKDKYRRRKDEKMIIYKNSGKMYWYWDPRESRLIPPFPPRMV